MTADSLQSKQGHDQMNTKNFAAALGVATLMGIVAIDVASAQTAQNSLTEHPLGEHPAVLVKRQAVTIDTNRYILMHPAQLMVVNAPTAIYEHPVVAIQR
jgi:hypothetical protein